ncbi:uncharacterized protein LOC120131001 [Hibiscus syriacus]|uniref:uncharacterized protein LOC120131001 n=1 Tax=Hibiscus syriacus TaxID=106335 RepID=UPI00192311D6|nr:uncharacterized protein LOC120131001 [Hibiscus syriacus]
MFFKISWSVVGEDVVNAVTFFFQEATIHQAFNSTILALIPKIQNPCKVKDYRPISCCSVVYKIITKILVKRLSLVLPDLINLNQTAFLKGRSIIDNTLLAQELVKGYGRKNISPSVLNHFYSLSGLNFNVNKTEFFAAGVSAGTLEFIKSATEFKQGFLPVRYLGVPLVTRKLTETYCFPLLDNFEARLHHWSGKSLSYVGHLELIKTVLYSVVNLWFQQFILLQKVINCLEQLCSRFIWKGSDKAAKGARISWNRLCCPKFEGGLGLKDLNSWNKACMIQLIRKLLARNRSLWVAWIHCYVIKNRELSDINVSSSFSWSIRKLLKLRTQALPIISAGITKTSVIWDELRENREKVTWKKLLWFPLHIPKHSMISWMIILDRLPTRDRLFRMGISNCILRNNEPESKNHLFFNCVYASSIWNSIMILTNLRDSHGTWNSRIECATQKWKGKSLLSIILRIVWNAFNYLIWEERNRRIFKGGSRTTDQILKSIKEFVRIQLSDKDINRTDHVNYILCSHWGLD